MAEEYTGDEGTEAAAAGMDVLDGTEDRRTGWLAINKTRDYLAAKLAAINWSSLIGKPTSFPNDDVTAATELLEVGTLVRRSSTGRFNAGTPVNPDNVTTKAYVDDASLRDGGTVEGSLTVEGNFGTDGRITARGDLYSPNATAASSGWTVAYLNGDGRLAKGASSERYKHDIDRTPEIPDLFAVPIASWVMNGDGDEVPRYSPIAEDLAADPALASFVVYDAEGRPDNLDVISYLMAAVGRLHARALDAETRIAALEAEREAD